MESSKQSIKDIHLEILRLQHEEEVLRQKSVESAYTALNSIRRLVDPANESEPVSLDLSVVRTLQQNKLKTQARNVLKRSKQDAKVKRQHQNNVSPDELVTLEKRLSEAESKLDSKTARFKEQKLLLEEVKSQNNNLRRAYLSLRGLVLADDKENYCFSDEQKDADGTDDLQAEIERLMCENSELKLDISSLKADLTLANALQDKNVDLREQVDKLQEQNMKLGDHISQLQEEINDFNSIKDENLNLKQKLEEERDELKQLHSKNSLLSEQILLLNDNLDEMKKSHQEDLIREKKVLEGERNEKIENLKSENGRLVKEIVALKLELDCLQSSIVECKTDSEGKEELEEVKKRNNELSEKVQLLEKSAQTMNESLSQSEEQEKKITMLQSKNRELSNTIIALKEELEVARQAESESESDPEPEAELEPDLEKEYEEQKSSESTSAAHVAELQQQHDELLQSLEMLKKENDCLHNENVDRIQCEKKLKVEISRLKKEITLVKHDSEKELEKQKQLLKKFTNPQNGTNSSEPEYEQYSKPSQYWGESSDDYDDEDSEDESSIDSDSDLYRLKPLKSNQYRMKSKMFENKLNIALKEREDAMVQVRNLELKLENSKTQLESLSKQQQKALLEVKQTTGDTSHELLQQDLKRTIHEKDQALLRVAGLEEELSNSKESVHALTLQIAESAKEISSLKDTPSPQMAELQLEFDALVREKSAAIIRVAELEESLSQAQNQIRQLSSDRVKLQKRLDEVSGIELEMQRIIEEKTEAMLKVDELQSLLTKSSEELEQTRKKSEKDVEELKQKLNASYLSEEGTPMESEFQRIIKEKNDAIMKVAELEDELYRARDK